MRTLIRSYKQKPLQRYFMVTKLLLVATPFLGYFYLSLQGLGQAKTMQGLLESNPQMVIIFIVVMINPYIAYLVSLIEKSLVQGRDDFAIINMALIMVAQLLCLNFFLASLLGWVFYKAIRSYRINAITVLKGTTIKSALFYGGGSLMVVGMSLLCLVASIRLI